MDGRVEKEVKGFRDFAFLLNDIRDARRDGDIDAELGRQLMAPVAQEARGGSGAGIAQADAILR